MSAAVAEPPVAPAPPVQPTTPQTSAVEYVRGLSAEDKEAVFFALLAEARAVGEDAGTLIITDPAGETVGYFLTPVAWGRLRDLPPDDESDEEFHRRASAPAEELLTLDQVTDALNRMAAARGR